MTRRLGCQQSYGTQVVIYNMLMLNIHLMIKNKLFIGLFSLSLCTSCSEDIPPANKVETEMSQVKMQLVIRDASTDESVLVENKVHSVDVFSFSRKQG
ncbi:MAG: hypothetical protein RR490_11045, partial [Niameybacter sp.]